MKRKAISKRIRFEVFKRDSFTCQYCSAKPPSVPLEVDHIVPISRGGINEIENLITACFDCNRGKSDVELNDIPNSLIEKTERIKLAQFQYLEYKKILKKQEKIINEEVEQINSVYNSFFEDYVLSASFKVTVKKFINQIGFEETKESMEYACVRVSDSSQSIKYFCGVCWNKIKEQH
jgi:hypothetical protein